MLEALFVWYDCTIEIIKGKPIFEEFQSYVVAYDSVCDALILTHTAPKDGNQESVLVEIQFPVL